MRTYETARRVMTTAHNIRRAAAEKFNCRISEIHWGECLRMAWASVKEEGNTMNNTIDIIRTFTNSWTHPRTGEERLYLNEDKAAKFIGLEVRRYKTGNIKFSEIDGEEISHSEAYRILGSMDRVFFDVTTGTWDHRHTSDRALKLILAKLSA